MTQVAAALSDKLAVLTAATVWGTTGTAATFAPAGSSALAIGAAAMGFGGLLLLVANPAPSIALLREQRVRRWLAFGGAAVAVYALSFYSAMATAGIALGVTLAIGSGPVFAVLYERRAYRVRVPRSALRGAALAISGAMLLGWSQLDVAGREAVSVLAGSLLGLLAGACWATYSMVSARLIQSGRQSRAVISAIFGLAAIPLVPVALLSGETLFSNGTGLVVVAYLVAVPMFCGYVLFARGLRSASAGLATTLSVIEVAVAALAAAAIAGQRLPPAGWLGVFLVAVGLVGLTRQPREEV